MAKVTALFGGTGRIVSEVVFAAAMNVGGSAEVRQSLGDDVVTVPNLSEPAQIALRRHGVAAGSAQAGIATR